jgi:salicylate hydroxylase
MPKVIVVGCGIVGPVMAVMLKKKGYDPVILERVNKLEPVGLSLALWPNG